VLDVVVDIRKGSPTYGQYEMCELTEENHRQFFVPKGMAHGFAVLSELAVFQYKCDDFYHPEAEGAIAWNDADIAIPWPISSEDVILSEKDKHHPCLKDFDSPFFYNR
jgi:dTDP-4-dehydrorhamnose 3,5-epimerase